MSNKTQTKPTNNKKLTRTSKMSVFPKGINLRSSLLRGPSFNKLGAIITVVSFVAVGMLMLFRSQATTSDITGLRVSGNKIVNLDGNEIRLLGVNHSGSSYACRDGWGFFDGPNKEAVQQSFVDGLKTWQVNAVRIDLNEHCWLDIPSTGSNGSVIPDSRRGLEYQSAITNYVNLLVSNGIVPIIELHYSAPGTLRTENNPMPNRDNSLRFWSSVATHFKSNSSVVFELLNEPHPDSNKDTAEAWRCWRDGGNCTGVVDRASGTAYTAAGMNELISVIRATGSTNIVLAGGIQYGNRLSRCLEYKPTDSTGNLAAAWHVYSVTGCSNTTCYESQVKPVALQVPIVATEIGPSQDCATCIVTTTSGFSTELLAWLDTYRVGYQAWTWNLWNSGGKNLIKDWTGAPTDIWGNQIKDHIAANIGTGGTNPPAPSKNMAAGIMPSSSVSSPSNPQRITDSVIDTAQYAGVGSGPQWIKIDLSQSYDLERVKLWHYYGDGRTYRDVIVQVSNDVNFNSGVTTVFNNDGNNSAGQGTGSDAEYTETSIGKDLTFGPVSARYVRLWSNGSTSNAYNHYVEVEVYAGSGGTTTPPPTADTAAPVVAIFSPTNGSPVDRSVSIKATATDNVKVTKMEVYIDGVLRSSSATGSISYTWNTKRISKGTHAITVRAYDAAGNTGQSSVVVYK